MAAIRKRQAASKRGTKGQGRLFKKAGAKQYPADWNGVGTFYLTYTVNGKRITQALRDADNKPITDRDQAEAERRRILAPFAAGGLLYTTLAGC